ncbi:hypothetical protein [Candidatus Tisiphia endosymbiont of Nedyus quadrimaculatus]|uniref:hypothetical protein n=1 Tax=Candidatus Tisiphia endosymbiont of Nedyus quadrimaculatus TaxID=3139332 RepID=UPI00345E1178
MKYDIIKKAVVLLGANVGISSIGGGRISKAEELCEEFVNPAIEDAVLMVKLSISVEK